MTTAPASATSQVARSVTAGWTGIVLAVALASWALASDPGAPDGAKVAAMVLLGSACWMAGGQLAAVRPEAPGLVVAALVATLMLLSLPESLSSAASAPPLAYANANGALVAVGLGGLLLSLPHLPSRLRPAGIAAAVAFLLAEIAIGSRAGLVTSVLLLLVVPNLGHGRRLAWQAAGALALVPGVAAVVLIGRGAVPEGIVGRTVGTTRAELWSDALGVAAGHPVHGVGAGRFAEYSDVARGDSDLAWAHSAPLQLAAELGWVGFAITACLLAWMVLALGRFSALLGVLALQPMIDYTLHFPAVVAGAMALLGLASAGTHWQSDCRSSRRRSDSYLTRSRTDARYTCPPPASHAG